MVQSMNQSMISSLPSAPSSGGLGSCLLQAVCQPLVVAYNHTLTDSSFGAVSCDVAGCLGKGSAAQWGLKPLGLHCWVRAGSLWGPRPPALAQWGSSLLCCAAMLPVVGAWIYLWHVCPIHRSVWAKATRAGKSQDLCQNGTSLLKWLLGFHHVSSCSWLRLQAVAMVPHCCSAPCSQQSQVMRLGCDKINYVGAVSSLSFSSSHHHLLLHPCALSKELHLLPNPPSVLEDWGEPGVKWK